MSSGADYNNNGDVQNFPGPAYTGPMDGAPGTTLIGRRGPVTYFRGTGNLTASRIFQFDTIANQGWADGDLVKVSLPSHTGGGFTVTVEDLAANGGTVLSTWPALLSNGGMYQYRVTSAPGVVPVTGAFQAVNPGNSIT
jgi:hypothetical protein